jgi:hypothetical protein
MVRGIRRPELDELHLRIGERLLHHSLAGRHDLVVDALGADKHAAVVGARWDTTTLWRPDCLLT